LLLSYPAINIGDSIRGELHEFRLMPFAVLTLDVLPQHAFAKVRTNEGSRASTAAIGVRKPSWQFIRIAPCNPGIVLYVYFQLINIALR